jgi:hypothetical protein
LTTGNPSHNRAAKPRARALAKAYSRLPVWGTTLRQEKEEEVLVDQERVLFFQGNKKYVSFSRWRRIVVLVVAVEW